MEKTLYFLMIMLMSSGVAIAEGAVSCACSEWTNLSSVAAIMLVAVVVFLLYITWALSSQCDDHAKKYKDCREELIESTVQYDKLAEVHADILDGAQKLVEDVDSSLTSLKGKDHDLRSRLDSFLAGIETVKAEAEDRGYELKAGDSDEGDVGGG